SNNLPSKITYKHSNGYEHFSFIDKNFIPQLPAQKDTIFCPKELRTSVWELMDKHLHLHPLIPMSSNFTLTLILHQRRKFDQIMLGRVKADWRKSMKSEWKQLTNRGTVLPEFFDQIKRNNQYPFWIKTDTISLMHATNANSMNETSSSTINDNQDEDSDAFFNQLIDTTKKTLDLLYEHKDTKNIKWGKSVEKNFRSVSTMVEQIETYRRRRTMPKTWKEHTHNT
ncbi:25512_t:CDS:2, partial [Gigaspora margarita]